MLTPIPPGPPLSRPDRSWIDPEGTTYPLHTADYEYHVQWIDKHLPEIAPYLYDSLYESNDGYSMPNMETMFEAGWIRRNGAVFQTCDAFVENAKKYIDQYEATGKYFTIVVKRDDGFWELGTQANEQLNHECWTKMFAGRSK
jgi:hypothetical protein